MEDVKTLVLSWLNQPAKEDETGWEPIATSQPESNIPEDYEHFNSVRSYEHLTADPINARISQLDKSGFASQEIAMKIKLSGDEVRKRRHQLHVAALEYLPSKTEPIESVSGFPTRVLSSELIALQRRIIADFHEAHIRLDRKVETTFGIFPRHSKGGLLTPLAMKLLPPELEAALSKAINDKGVCFVYINETVMTIPREWFKIKIRS